MSAEAVRGLGGQVENALRRAASATGVDFNFLVRTAKRESGFNPGAQASTSSAAGLFQFVEQTWLTTLKRHGAAHGYERYAALIQQGSDGRYHVDGEAKQAVMDLRFDPHAASVMAAELASDHAAYLRGRVGREPTGGELYAAHFLGPQGSARLIEAYRYAPNAAAASYFPDAAASNRGVFYRDGRPLSIAEVYANLNATGSSAVPMAPAAEPADPGEAAFAAYAGARSEEKHRQEALLVGLLLSGEGAQAAGPFGAMYSADLLTLLARNQDTTGTKGLY